MIRHVNVFLLFLAQTLPTQSITFFLFCFQVQTTPVRSVMSLFFCCFLVQTTPILFVAFFRFVLKHRGHRYDRSSLWYLFLAQMKTRRSATSFCFVYEHKWHHYDLSCLWVFFRHRWHLYDPSHPFASFSSIDETDTIRHVFIFLLSLVQKTPI